MFKRFVICCSGFFFLGFGASGLLWSKSPETSKKSGTRHPDSSICKSAGTLEDRTLAQDKFDRNGLTTYIFEAAHHFKIPPALLMAILSLETTNLNPLAENENEKTKPSSLRHLASVQKKKNPKLTIATAAPSGSKYLWGKGLAMFGALDLSKELDEVLLDWNADKPKFAAAVWLPAYNIGTRVTGDSRLRFPIWSPRGSVLAMANYLSFFRKKLWSDEKFYYDQLFSNDKNWIHRSRYFGAMYNQGPENVITGLKEFFSANGFVPVAYGQALEMRNGETHPASEVRLQTKRFRVAKNYVYQIAGLCGEENQGLIANYQSRVAISIELWKQNPPSPLKMNPPLKNKI